MSHSISNEVHRRLFEIPGMTKAGVDTVREPQWRPEMITPEGRKHLKIA